MDLRACVVDDYLGAAATVLATVEKPQVSQHWRDPSALAGLTVGGLAAHLLAQLDSTVATAQNAVTATDSASLVEHYQRVPWVGASLTSETNVAIRKGSEHAAAAGHRDAVKMANLVLAELSDLLPTMPLATLVQPPWAPWTMTLEDFLVTRLLEMTIHADDLAFSVNISPPPLTPEVTRRVLHLLLDIAVDRHGTTDLLRALSRAERSPKSISAF